MMAKVQILEQFEDYRDERWCREATRQVATAFDAERFIVQVGFAACMTDARRPGPSLQAAMIVVPSQVFYQPKFTYVWTLAVGRFPDALRRRISRDTALREIARAFLSGAGMTIPGELARVTGLSRPDAGRGNRALVAEGYATMRAPGTYLLANRADAS